MSFFKSIFKNYPYLTLFSLFLFLFFLIFNVFSWTIPQDNPPNSNLPAPLNVSSQEQTKEGNLNINGLLRLGRFTSHPTGTNGALYYNTTDNKFYGYSNGSWQELSGGFWALSNNNIYNTNSGNVGIGTTAPSEKFEVKGGNINIKINTNQAWNGYRWKMYYNTNQYIAGIEASDPNVDWRGVIRFLTAPGGGENAPIERMRIDSNGNVGIGTTAPSHKLDIALGGYQCKNLHLWIRDYSQYNRWMGKSYEI
jgi:hypothetical protein